MRAEMGGMGEGGVVEMAGAADVKVAALEARVLERLDGRLAAVAHRLALQRRQLFRGHDPLKGRGVVGHLDGRLPMWRGRLSIHTCFRNGGRHG